MSDKEYIVKFKTNEGQWVFFPQIILAKTPNEAFAIVSENLPWNIMPVVNLDEIDFSTLTHDEIKALQNVQIIEYDSIEESAPALARKYKAYIQRMLKKAEEKND